jgi:hypothetical protein
LFFAYFGSINMGVLTAQIVPRRSGGRPITVASSWSDVSGGAVTTKAHNPAWFLKELETRSPFRYYQWQCIVSWNWLQVVGIVFSCNKVNGIMLWSLYFPDYVETKDEGTRVVNAVQLAEALAPAGKLGLAGPSLIAPPAEP